MQKGEEQKVLLNDPQYAALPRFVRASAEKLTDCVLNYVPAVDSVYLHGSACLGAFVPGQSDIDVLVVSRADMSREQRLAFGSALLDLRKPSAPLELSVVRAEDIAKLPVICQFHFSDMYAEMYRTKAPDNPLLRDFPDPDIPAYLRLIRERGIVLYGRPPAALIPEISDAEFIRSVTAGIDDFAFEDYGLFDSNILTLARILSFIRTGRILSKCGGADWAKRAYPQFEDLLTRAEKAYLTASHGDYGAEELGEYRSRMIGEIRKGAETPC